MNDMSDGESVGLFHLAGASLEAGSVIRAGNWGRVVSLYGWAHPQGMREMALEGARLARYPGEPSRLQCAFVCLSEIEARAYKDANNLHGHALLRVELVEPALPLFITSWGLCNPNGNFRHDWADAYWDGNSYKTVHCTSALFPGVPAREGLTLSALRVLDCLGS